MRVSSPFPKVSLTVEQFLTKLNECNQRGIGDVVCFQACIYRRAIEVIPIIPGMQNNLENRPTLIFTQHD
jgi:hypothetical protein